MREPALQPDDAAPLRAPDCPLCGGPNGCAASASGSFETPCWCMSVAFAPELLARLPAEAVNRACICARCAGAASGPATRG
jgi:hypothetical protein